MPSVIQNNKYLRGLFVLFVPLWFKNNKHLGVLGVLVVHSPARLKRMTELWPPRPMELDIAVSISTRRASRGT